MSRRRSYSREFKLEAIRLLEQGEQNGAELARELGVRRNQLYKWKEQRIRHGDTGAFRGPGRRIEAGEADELARLRRENAQLRQERDILKKAAAYFAKELP
jgi:transposase